MCEPGSTRLIEGVGSCGQQVVHLGSWQPSHFHRFNSLRFFMGAEKNICGRSFSHEVQVQESFVKWRACEGEHCKHTRSHSVPRSACRMTSLVSYKQTSFSELHC